MKRKMRKMGKMRKIHFEIEDLYYFDDDVENKDKLDGRKRGKR